MVFEASSPSTPKKSGFAGRIQWQISPAPEFDDFFFGTDEDDNIFGMGGNDFLFGQGGNDLVDGGDDNDCVRRRLWRR